MRLAIVTGGFFSVPLTDGGAVEALVQSIVDENEKRRELDLVVYSCYDPDSEALARTYRYAEFRFVKIPEVVKAVDRVVYWVFKNVLGKKKHLSYRYLFQRLRYVRSVGRDLAKRPVDRIVFENHPTLLMSLRMRGNGERYEGRYFYHVHNILSGFYGCEKEMLGCRKVLGVSGYALREIAKLAQGRFSASRLAMHRNKVDEGIFTGMLGEDEALALRIKHGIPDGARVVLFGGRLCPEKGALELVEAFAKVETEEAVLLVLGSYYYGSKMKSEYEMKLSSAAESLGDRIIFTGFVKHEEMPSYYAMADVVVAPSVWSDSAPLAVIEPLTAKRPVVTTAMGGIPEYATDGVDSVILPVDDDLVGNLAKSIDAILDGSIRLVQNVDADWSVKSYYDDFCRLVGE